MEPTAALKLVPELCKREISFQFFPYELHGEQLGTTRTSGKLI